MGRLGDILAPEVALEAEDVLMVSGRGLIVQLAVLPVTEVLPAREGSPLLTTIPFAVIKIAPPSCAVLPLKVQPFVLTVPDET